MLTVDIWSKGETVRHHQDLLKVEQIRDCMHMKLEQGYLDAYYPRCLEDWASRQKAYNVSTDSTAYHAPSSYWWPELSQVCLK